MNVDSDSDFGEGEREELLSVPERELIFKLMSKNSEPEEWAEWLRAPLERACESGDSELVDALLEAGADGAARGLGGSGRTLLHAAAAGGNENVLWSLLDAGAKPDIDVRLSDEDGDIPADTPLQVAVRKGHAAAAKVLVAAGADTARTLILAVENGHDEIACDLLLAGADPDEPGIIGGALAHASRLGYERLVRALLQQQEAEVSAPAMGYTALHEAARGGHANVAKVLLSAGLNVDAFTWQGETPLHAAAEHGSAATVGVLIAAGADVGGRHAILGKGQSPLHIAAERGRVEAARALLRHGADVNAADGSDHRPLHLACGRARADMVDLLLKRGADETAVDAVGRRPADLLPSAESIADDVARCGATEGTTHRQQQERDDRRDAYTRRRLDERDRAARLLARAPNDRAWRRRGFAVLCRARAETLRLEAAAAAGPAMPPGGRVASAAGCCSNPARRRRENTEVEGGVRGGAGRGGGGGAGDDRVGGGAHGLGGWVVDLEEDGIFRNIVGFL